MVGPVHLEHAFLETAPVHDVGFSVDDRLQELWHVAGVVFKIRILDHDKIAGGFLETAHHRPPLALVGILLDDFVSVFWSKLFQDGKAAVP